MKNRAKTFISLILISTFLVAGCSSNRQKQETPKDASDPALKYDPEIELTIEGGFLTKDENGYDYLHNPWIDAYKEELGINIVPKWDVDETTDAAENLTEQLAIGVLPDIMAGLGRGQFDFLVRTGLATDITDFVDQYATPLTKEILNSDGGYALNSSSYDGRLYALPYVYGNTDNISLMWIRTDWLKNLGLEYPKTAEELYHVLDAFVNDDPDRDGINDTVGLCSSQSLWEVGSIFNMFGAQPFWSWYYDENKVLRYSTVSFTDQIKEALSFLQELFKNGLMYSEFGVIGSEQYYNLFREGKAGIAFDNKSFPYAVQEGVIQSDSNADWQAFPLPSELAGNAPARPFSYFGPAAYNVISSKCKNPEAAIKMLNLFTEIKFSDEKDQYTSKFIIDENGNNIEHFAILTTAKANDLSEYEHTAAAVAKRDPAELSFSEKVRYDACMKFLAGDRKFWGDYKLYGSGNVSTDILQYYIKDVRPFFSDYNGPNTASERQIMSLLDSKWLETCTRIIMSGEDVNNYDDFVSQWYSLGGDKMEEEINNMNNKLSSDNKGAD